MFRFTKRLLTGGLRGEFIPTMFPEANKNLKAPEGWEEGECGELPCLEVRDYYEENPQHISKWKVSGLIPRLKVLLTGSIWMHVHGTNHPPIALTVGSPIMKKKQYVPLEELKELVHDIMDRHPLWGVNQVRKEVLRVTWAEEQAVPFDTVVLCLKAK